MRAMKLTSFGCGFAGIYAVAVEISNVRQTREFVMEMHQRAKRLTDNLIKLNRRSLLIAFCMYRVVQLGQ